MQINPQARALAMANRSGGKLSSEEEACTVLDAGLEITEYILAMDSLCGADEQWASAVHAAYLALSPPHRPSHNLPRATEQACRQIPGADNAETRKVLRELSGYLQDALDQIRLAYVDYPNTVPAIDRQVQVFRQDLASMQSHYQADGTIPKNVTPINPQRNTMLRLAKETEDGDQGDSM